MVEFGISPVLLASDLLGFAYFLEQDNTWSRLTSVGLNVHHTSGSWVSFGISHHLLENSMLLYETLTRSKSKYQITN